MSPRDIVVPVDGGELGVGVYGPEDAAATVLAIHGITASSRAWIALAAELPDVRILAPDLRGRGSSGGLPGPYGLRQHAADLERVLDHVGVDRVTVVGHSMGGFVAVLAAVRLGARVPAVVLVDGGIPLALPEGLTSLPADADPAAVLGPAYQRLTMTFESREQYRGFWQAHPAIAGRWNDAFREYVDYDLRETPDGLRPSGNVQAIAADSVELYGSDWYLAALRGLSAPVTVLRAPRGLLDADPLYPPGALEAARQWLPQLEVVEVPDVNHYTIVMARPGVGIVADAVRSAL